MSKPKTLFSDRKLRKLRRDPRLFFADAIRKRADAVTDLATRTASRLPVSGFLQSKHRYSVVSAVYNVEKYLDRYFESMAGQTLRLGEHIELILVDDGSTDGSAEIIRKWQKKYPKGIRYLRKDNGGQASARNVGLGHVTGDWVTFVDPDDFVHARYFEQVDRFLTANEDVELGLLCCRWIFYFETGARFVDNHPLGYRFRDGSFTTLPDERADFMAPSAATSFYRADLLAQAGRYFDEQIRPNFEDAHFTCSYLLDTMDLHVGFVADAHYYYRKRGDGSSTLDQGWSNPSRFDAVLEHGHLSLFRQALERHGEVPTFVQRLVLYDLIWSFKKIVDDESSVSFLSDTQKRRFRELLAEVFEHIDETTILRFGLAGCWFFHKVGFLGLMKGAAPPFQIAYVKDYDETKNLVLLSYFFWGELPAERLSIDGEDVLPRFAKARLHDFLGEVFAEERLLWVELGSGYSTLTVEIDGAPAQISLADTTHRHGVSRSTIARELRRDAKVRPALSTRALRAMARSSAAAKYADAWMLLDRDGQADDNAEHLYRHILREHPELNAWFVLREDSHDWHRLEEEGFRLIAFGSLQHKLCLLNAAHVLSSHADSFVLHVLPQQDFGDMLNFKFTFLQHGVIRDDISGWLNAKKIALFVTSSPREHESVGGERSRYKFGDRETKMVGLARHDALLERTEETENVVLIMPTWRQYLVSGAAHGTTGRSSTSAFYESTYARTWKALLHSEELRDLVENHGYRVVFFPHANMQLYADWFEAPAWVDLRTHATEPVLQKLYRRAAVMVTDYSSVFFEMGLLDKPVVYYQFDRDEMYGGKHPSRLGYFDFERDGFGPVVESERDLLSELGAILDRDCRPSAEYLGRMRETLPLRDGGNRERTVQAVLALDAPTLEGDTSGRLTIQMAEATSRTASRTGDLALWHLALARWEQVCATGAAPEGCTFALVQALRSTGELSAARQLLARAPSEGVRFRVEEALLQGAGGHADGLLAFWGGLRHEELVTAGLDSTAVGLEVARLLRANGRLKEAGATLASLEPSRSRELELAALDVDRQDWREAVIRLKRLIESTAGHPSAALLISLASAHRHQGELGKALACVDTMVKRGDATTQAALLRAELLLELGNTDPARKAAVLLAKGSRRAWNEHDNLRLAKVLAGVGLHSEAEAALEGHGSWVSEAARFDVLVASERWSALLAMNRDWMAELPPSERAQRQLWVARALRELGEVEEAELVASRFRSDFPEHSGALLEYAETLQAAQRWGDALAAWEEHRRAYPERDVQKVRARTALALEHLGRHDEATAVITEGARVNALQRLQLDPHCPAAYQQLVQLMLGQQA